VPTAHCHSAATALTPPGPRCQAVDGTTELIAPAATLKPRRPASDSTRSGPSLRPARRARRRRRGWMNESIDLPLREDRVGTRSSANGVATATRTSPLSATVSPARGSTVAVCQPLRSQRRGVPMALRDPQEVQRKRVPSSPSVGHRTDPAKPPLTRQNGCFWPRNFPISHHVRSSKRPCRAQREPRNHRSDLHGPDAPPVDG
jgi:hypothetical protein